MYSNRKCIIYILDILYIRDPYSSKMLIFRIQICFKLDNVTACFQHQLKNHSHLRHSNDCIVFVVVVESCLLFSIAASAVYPSTVQPLNTDRSEKMINARSFTYSQLSFRLKSLLEGVSKTEVKREKKKTMKKVAEKKQFFITTSYKAVQSFPDTKFPKVKDGKKVFFLCSLLTQFQQHNSKVYLLFHSTAHHHFSLA